MKKTYAILNLLSTIFLIYWNYLANTGIFKGNTMGELSDRYANLFTPAGYAFSIWGIIFLALLGFSIFQVIRAFSARKNGDFIAQIGPWFLIANLANIAWVYFWLNEITWVTPIIMAVILVALIIIILRLNMERWNAPRSIIAWVWWPICLYSGWISVAMIANVAAYLSKIEFQALFSEVTWAAIMIVAAILVNLFMIKTRNMREFALVGVWALIGIAVRHWNRIPLLQYLAIGGAVILFVAVSIQAYQNRAKNSMIRDA